MPDWFALAAVIVASLLSGFGAGYVLAGRQVSRAWMRYLHGVQRQWATSLREGTATGTAAPPERGQDGQETHQPVEARPDPRPQQH